MKKTILFVICLVSLLCSCTTTKSKTVTIEGNPTTGYQWTCKIDNESIVSLVSNDFMVNKSDPGMVGVGGKYHFVFAPGSEGKTLITFEYARSWENKAIETKTYIAEVKKNSLTLTEQ